MSERETAQELHRRMTPRMISMEEAFDFAKRLREFVANAPLPEDQWFRISAIEVKDDGRSYSLTLSGAFRGKVPNP